MVISPFRLFDVIVQTLTNFVYLQVRALVERNRETQHENVCQVSGFNFLLGQLDLLINPSQ